MLFSIGFTTWINMLPRAVVGLQTLFKGGEIKYCLKMSTYMA